MPTETKPVFKSLESRAVIGSIWTAVEYASMMALRICSSLILTRLLIPTYFGEVTLVTTMIMGITLLSDIGLGPSVIQSPRGDDPDFLNTAWTIQSIRGVALWIIACLIAWPVSLFYRDPKLLLILPILSFYVVLGGLCSSNLLSLSRHMSVRRMFAIDFSAQLVTFLVTVAWAYKWPSVWAIVAGNIVSNIYHLIISHNRKVTPGIRNRFRWEPEAVKSIVHFGKWILIGTAFFFFASQADRLILGRLVSFAMLGIYGIAYSLSDVPRSILLALGTRIGYPFIAKIIHLPLDEFRERFFRYRLYALTLGALTLSPMVVWGDQLVIHLYDLRYRDAAWMIPILAVGLWHTMLYTTTGMVLFSLGMTKYNALGNALYAAMIVISIPIAFHFFGMLGAVIAVAAGDFPLYLVTQFGLRRERVSPFRQDLLMTSFFVTILSCLFLLRKFL